MFFFVGNYVIKQQKYAYKIDGRGLAYKNDQNKLVNGNISYNYITLTVR